MMGLKCDNTTSSNIFITNEVKATGLQSSRRILIVFGKQKNGGGLKQAGTFLQRGIEDIS